MLFRSETVKLWFGKRAPRGPCLAGRPEWAPCAQRGPDGCPQSAPRAAPAFGTSASCPLTERTRCAARPGQENPSPERRAPGPGAAAEARGRAVPADPRRSPLSALSGTGTARRVRRLTAQRRGYCTSTEMGSSAPARRSRTVAPRARGDDDRLYLSSARPRDAEPSAASLRPHPRPRRPPAQAETQRQARGGTDRKSVV